MSIVVSRLGQRDAWAADRERHAVGGLPYYYSMAFIEVHTFGISSFSSWISCADSLRGMQIGIRIVGEAESMEAKRLLLPGHSFEGDPAPYRMINPRFSTWSGYEKTT